SATVPCGGGPSAFSTPRGGADPPARAILTSRIRRTNEEDFRDPSLAITRRSGDRTDTARTNSADASQEPGQQRTARHSARPPEEHHCSRRSHARRQIQLQTYRRPEYIRPSRGPHDRSE